jgi:16S rRNA (uracil1498-N3)-methyltransferase
MGHVPHLLLDRPWTSDRIDIPQQQHSHLSTVLRIEDGERVSYTDGRGAVGEGRYLAGSVVRGEEAMKSRPTDLIVVASPPHSRDRARFMVEKLAELGVAELRFLRTVYGRGRPPRDDRTRAWAVSALEQSRGAWLMKTPSGLVDLEDVEGPYAVCDQGGSTERPLARTVVIGPEAGWAPDEIPTHAIRFDLGDTVLRVETAAIVAAARLI